MEQKSHYVSLIVLRLRLFASDLKLPIELLLWSYMHISQFFLAEKYLEYLFKANDIINISM